MKDLVEEPHVSAFRTKYEAGRSFDLEDDMEFCPGLLTESDVSLLHTLLDVPFRCALHEKEEGFPDKGTAGFYSQCLGTVFAGE